MPIRRLLSSSDYLPLPQQCHVICSRGHVGASSDPLSSVDTVSVHGYEAMICSFHCRHSKIDIVVHLDILEQAHGLICRREVVQLKLNPLIHLQPVKRL